MKRLLLILLMQLVIVGYILAQSSDFCNFYIRSGFDSECLISDFKDNPDYYQEEHHCLIACRGTHVTYSIIGLPSNSSYNWTVSGADSYTTNTSNNTITVNWSESSGIGTLSLSVYGPDDEFCEKQLCIDLIEKPVAGIVSNPTELGHLPSGIKYIDVCDGQEIQFYDNSTSTSDSPIVGYYWRAENETAFTQNYSFTADYSIFGHSVDIVHKVVNECGCEDSVLYRVNISRYPTLRLSCYGTACENTTATYRTSGCSSYMWYVEGGHIQDGQGTNTLAVTWDDIDDGYGYIAIDGTSCGQMSCPYLSYMPIPVISDNVEIQGPDVVCVDDIVYFELPQWASTEYTWSITPVTNVSELFSGHRHKYLIQFENQGSYTINCTYNCGFLGCGGVAQSKVVTVKKPFSIVSDKEACVSESVSFETDFPNDVFDWTIYHNGTSIYTQTASSISYTFGTAGEYTIEASSPNFCNTAYASININASPAPQPDVSGWANRICLNGSSTYSAMPSSPEYYLHWSTSCGSPSEYDGNDYNVTFQSLPCTINLQQIDRKNGCSSLPYQYQVTQFVPQTINWPAYEACANEEFQMSVTPESGVQLEWQVLTGNADIVSDKYSTPVDIQVNDYYGQMRMLLNRKYCNNLVIRDTVPITVKPYLIPEISMPSSVCQYGTAAISAGNTEQFQGIWTWNVEGSTNTYTGLASGATWQHTFNNAGTIPVRMGFQTPGCTNVYESVETIEVIPAPQFSLSYYVQGNNSYLINATVMDPNATGYTYAWNPNVGTSPSFVHNGSSFNYTCTVTDITTGCTSSKNISQNSSIIPGPDPGCSYVENNASVVLTSRNCNSITFTHNSSLGGNSEWAFGQNVSNPQIALSGTNNSVCTATFSSSGYYRVVAGRMYNNCMYTADLQFCVPMIARLKVGYSCAAGTGINLELEDISDYMSGTIINSTSWYVDGILVSNPSSCPVTSGTHTVMLTVNYTYDNITESCSTTQTVTYNRGTAAFTVSSGPYCSETGIQFTDNSTNAISWEWSFDDGTYIVKNNSQSPEQSYIYNIGSGQMQIIITLNAQDNLGCVSQAATSINVNPNNLQGGLAADPVVCYGNPRKITYSYTSGMPLTSPSYQWFEINQTTTVQYNDIYESGLYYVRVTDNNGCATQSNWVNIVFNSSPVAEITGAADYCPDGEITLIGESGDNTYQWTGLGQSPITTANLSYGIAANNLSAGNYTVTLTVSKNGCSSTATKAITVHQAPATPTIGFGANRCLHIPPANLISTTGQSLNWSTGAFGPDTETFNAGFHTAYYTDPATGCRSANAEIEVPKPPDFNELMSGCFEFCKQDLPRYVLGPLGYFDTWKWYYNNTINNSGTGIISSLQVHRAGTFFLNVSYGGGYCQTTSDDLIVNTKEICDSCNIEIEITKEPECYVDGCKLIVQFLASIYNPTSGTMTLNGINSPSIGSIYQPSLPVAIGPGATASVAFRFALANYEPQELYMQLLFSGGDNSCYLNFFLDLSSVLENCIGNDCLVSVDGFDYLGGISSAGMSYFSYLFLSSSGMSDVQLYSDDVTIVDVNYNASTGEISGILSITPLELQQLVDSSRRICFRMYACYNGGICKKVFCVPAEMLSTVGSKRAVSGGDETEGDEYHEGGIRSADFCLYPNPANSAVSISGDNFYRATVIEASGRTVMEVYDTTFSIGGLRNGEYIVKVVSLDGSIQYLKLIKR